MSLDPITAGIDLVTSVINKFSSGTDKAKALFELKQLEQNGELEFLKAKMSVLLAEAQSADPWTSRARPSFMYVVYVLLLFSLPMGVVYAISPQTATAITTGVNAWFSSLPKDIIELFQWVMLGYIGGRSFEKVKGVTK